MTQQISCEGPTCNGGICAADREAAIVRDCTPANYQMRDEAIRAARGLVSRQLAVTSHARVGLTPRGQALFACSVCHYERIYGNVAWNL